MDSLSSIANEDFSSSLVQEIAASLTDQRVPERYINKNGYTPAEETITDLPIDFSRLTEEDELRKLRSALSTLGCFQMVNHGLEKLMDKVIDVSKQFFALPLSEKKKWYGATGLYLGYGNDAALWGTPDQPQIWNDRLYLPSDVEFLPDNPPELRTSACELNDKIKFMPETILKAMARSLDLQEDCFLKEHGSDGVFKIKLSLYPRCPNPDRVLGIPPHSDGTSFSMLVQDHEGLQIMADDHRWLKVPVIPGAIIVIAGDIMEMLSNGAIKSAVHRVVTNSEKERYMVGIFHCPNIVKEFGPVEELVSANRPKLYERTTMIGYGQVRSEFGPKGKSSLSAFKV